MIEGDVENGWYRGRMKWDWEYEKEESWVRTVNERMKDKELTSLVALMVTDWEETDWEGIPEITPVSGLRDSPEGRDPEVIENEGLSPLMKGVIENGSDTRE